MNYRELTRKMLTEFRTYCNAENTTIHSDQCVTRWEPTIADSERFKFLMKPGIETSFGFSRHECWCGKHWHIGHTRRDAVDMAMSCVDHQKEQGIT